MEYFILVYIVKNRDLYILLLYIRRLLKKKNLDAITAANIAEYSTNIIPPLALCDSRGYYVKVYFLLEQQTYPNDCVISKKKVFLDFLFGYAFYIIFFKSLKLFFQPFSWNVALKLSYKL